MDSSQIEGFSDREWRCERSISVSSAALEERMCNSRIVPRRAVAAMRAVRGSGTTPGHSEIRCTRSNSAPLASNLRRQRRHDCRLKEHRREKPSQEHRPEPVRLGRVEQPREDVAVTDLGRFDAKHTEEVELRELGLEPLKLSVSNEELSSCRSRSSSSRRRLLASCCSPTRRLPVHSGSSNRARGRRLCSMIPLSVPVFSSR